MKKVYIILIIIIGTILESCKTTYIYKCDCIDKPLKIKYDYPDQKDGMSDEDYVKHINFLKSIYEDYRYKQKYPDKRKEFSTAVPWNLAIAYSRLQEPKEKIFCLLCKEEEERGIEMLAQHFNNYDADENPLNLSMIEIDSLVKRYQPYFSQITEQKSTPGSIVWAKDTLDQELISLMKSIVEQDQKYRSEGTDYFMKNLKKQTEIDSINIIKIDSLYDNYGTYIGRSLVGESNEYAMWAVIQHASLEKQEYYLPIVQRAVEDFELKDGPFKMLIDRVYSRKYGYQIFGSQQGVVLGSKSQLKKAKKKFNLME